MAVRWKNKVGDLDVLGFGSQFWLLGGLVVLFLLWVLVNFLFRTWGIVLVDLRPASLRAAVALRLP